MYVPFENIPEHARVWIYQASRPLSDTEIQLTQQKGQQFVKQWAAHGQDLHASTAVLHRHFLIFALDEHHHAASGCSIDSSVGFVRAIEEALSTSGQTVSFFDRTLIAFYQDDTVRLVPLPDAKTQIATGHIASDTLTFNNLVGTKGDLEDQWLVPIKDSWLARHLPKVQA